MAVASRTQAPGVGDLLRSWRKRRNLSQMELSLDSAISTRHLSFVETGRAKPSREMVLHLAEQLKVPPRERNSLLLAAGFAPLYTDGVAPELLQAPANALRITLHPEGMAPRIVNFAEWRAHILKRLRRRAAISADGELERLYEELKGYPGVERQGPLADTLEHDIVLPLRLAHPRGELTFLSSVSTFGTANDVTLAELAIEAFYPADTETAVALLNDRNSCR